jgi:hypothetical protein
MRPQRCHPPPQPPLWTPSEATIAQIQSLSMEQLEALADALYHFQDSTDLTSWLAANS